MLGFSLQLAKACCIKRDPFQHSGHFWLWKQLLQARQTSNQIVLVFFFFFLAINKETRCQENSPSLYSASKIHWLNVSFQSSALLSKRGNQKYCWLLQKCIRRFKTFLRTLLFLLQGIEDFFYIIFFFFRLLASVQRCSFGLAVSAVENKRGRAPLIGWSCNCSRFIYLFIYLGLQGHCCSHHLEDTMVATSWFRRMYLASESLNVSYKD